MRSTMFEIKLVFIFEITAGAGRIVKSNVIEDECSSNYLNITCTFMSSYGSLFKRTPNNCYSTLNSITDFSVFNCNEQYLFDIFRDNDKNYVIGYKNEDHRNFMSKLKQIQWNYSQIQSLEPANFSTFSNLKKIDLAHNKLNHLGSGVFDAASPQLKVLILSHNNISRIEPTAFEKLDTLEVLNLACNKLETLPLLRQATLKEIYLNNNQFKSINGDFHSQFPLIVNVYLMHNQLTQLTLHDNGPTEIDLLDNQLTQLRIIVGDNGSFLKRLHLQNNKLMRIETFDRISDKLTCNLNYLDLTSNNVTDLAFLVKMRELRIIHLADNDLSQLKNDDFRRLFIALQHMEMLDLGRCRLDHSDEQFVLDGNYSGSSEISESNDETVGVSAPASGITHYKCEGLKKLLDEAKNLKYLQLMLEDLNSDHCSVSWKMESMKNGNCRDDEIQRVNRMQKDLLQKHASVFEYLKNNMNSVNKDDANQ